MSISRSLNFTLFQSSREKNDKEDDYEECGWGNLNFYQYQKYYLRVEQEDVC